MSIGITTMIAYTHERSSNNAEKPEYDSRLIKTSNVDDEKKKNLKSEWSRERKKREYEQTSRKTRNEECFVLSPIF